MSIKKSEYMKSVYILCISFALVALLMTQCETIVTFCVGQVVSHRSKRIELPESGEYYCMELDASLVFDHEKDILLITSDGTEYLMSPVANTGQIVNLEEDYLTIDGWYKSNAMKGYIDIAFTEFPSHFEENQVYRFTRIE